MHGKASGVKFTFSFGSGFAIFCAHGATADSSELRVTCSIFHGFQVPWYLGRYFHQILLPESLIRPYVS